MPFISKDVNFAYVCQMLLYHVALETPLTQHQMHYCNHSSTELQQNIHPKQINFYLCTLVFINLPQPPLHELDKAINRQAARMSPGKDGISPVCDVQSVNSCNTCTPFSCSAGE